MGVYERARRRTRERIVNEFWKLYKEKPIEKITVRDVSEASGIHRSTFYQHFQDVYQVLEVIEGELLERLGRIDAGGADTEHGLDAIGRALFDECRASKEQLSVLVKERRDYAFAMRYHGEVQRFIEGVIRWPEEPQSPLNEKLVSVTAFVIVEAFVHFAADEAFSYEDTRRIMAGFMDAGYYRTLEGFGVAGLRRPDVI